MAEQGIDRLVLFYESEKKTINTKTIKKMVA
jgi:hypothetical protein